MNRKQLLDSLDALAQDFETHGGTMEKHVAICLFTILGAYNQGSRAISALRTLCLEFAEAQLGGLNN